MRSNIHLFIAAACATIILVGSAQAKADASSWVFVGGGPLVWKRGTGTVDYTTSGAMQIDVGVGTTPDNPVIVGGLFRLQPIFGSGTDLGFLARGATRGFQAGGFGVAIDAGAYLRTWGTSATGFQGGLTIGAPLGLTVCLLGSIGNDSATAFGATLGFDFLRMTVYRRSMLEDWFNPYPSPQDTASRGFSQPRF